MEDLMLLGSVYQHTRHEEIKGIATAYCVYITGCNQIEIERILNGKIEKEWYDTKNLKLVGTKTAYTKDTDGGPVHKPTNVIPPNGF